MSTVFIVSQPHSVESAIFKELVGQSTGYDNTNVKGSGYYVSVVMLKVTILKKHKFNKN